MISPVHDIGDRVFYTLPETDPMIVTDIIYRFSTKRLEYQVFDGEEYNWVQSSVLTDQKPVI